MLSKRKCCGPPSERTKTKNGLLFIPKNRFIAATTESHYPQLSLATSPPPSLAISHKCDRGRVIIYVHVQFLSCRIQNEMRGGFWFLSPLHCIKKLVKLSEIWIIVPVPADFCSQLRTHGPASSCLAASFAGSQIPRQYGTGSAKREQNRTLVNRRNSWKCHGVLGKP